MSPVQRFPPGWNMTDFHQRLRQLRTARKITQTRVAELLGVSPRTVLDGVALAERRFHANALPPSTPQPPQRRQR